MSSLLDTLKGPWPWYVAGPLIGLTIPLLLVIGNKSLGVSSSLRHTCAALFPAGVQFLEYDWKKESWNLLFAFGIALGAFLASRFFANPSPMELSADTSRALSDLGILDRSGLVPADLFSWKALASLPGFLAVVVGGFLVGFGSRYAGGCTSGHAIMGLSNLQWTSLVAVCGFFAGGLLVTHFLLPVILGVAS